MTARMPVVAGVAGWLLAGCASSYVSRAPSSPATSWKPASGQVHDFTLPREPSLPVPAENPASVDSGRVYNLPDLVDIAESSNPDTRIGWERARQAALGVGLAKAEYLPTISALALGGFRHSSIPLTVVKNVVISPASDSAPGISIPVPVGTTGRVGIDTFDVLPFLAIRWQLLDLGRSAGVDAAEHFSAAANLSFTAEHQKVVLDVTRAYLRLGAARAQTAVARDALERTRGIAKAAQARFDRGLATTVETVETRREVAQAEYNLSQAQALQTQVYTALLSTMGIDPLLKLEIATNRSRDLPPQLMQQADEYLHAALKTRPDLQAALALRSSADSIVSKREASFLPKMSLLGTAGTAFLGARADGGSFTNANIPNAGVMVAFDWLLFDGGVRDAEAEIARSRRNEAEQTIAKLQRQTTQEVVSAYNEVNASLSRYKAASSLEKTAAVAEDAVTKSYANGLSTLTDALGAQKAHFLASAAKEQAFADALISATALTFASGQLGSAS